jgi:hypothetical protein
LFVFFGGVFFVFFLVLWRFFLRRFGRKRARVRTRTPAHTHTTLSNTHTHKRTHLAHDVDEKVGERHAPDEGVFQHVADELLEHVGLGLGGGAGGGLGGLGLDRREAQVLGLVAAVFFMKVYFCQEGGSEKKGGRGWETGAERSAAERRCFFIYAHTRQLSNSPPQKKKH